MSTVVAVEEETEIPRSSPQGEMERLAKDQW